MNGLRRLLGILPVIACLLLVVFVVTANQMVGFRIETDRDTCFVGENVTASIVHFNDLPFPVPQSAVTRVEFGCTLNGEPLDAGYLAHLTPSGDIYLMPPGSEVWLFPITVAPQVNGTLIFTARIGMEQLTTYEKQVIVFPR
jgi:hypothetical protein